MSGAQGDLLDLVAAMQARDEAIQRADDHADPEWRGETLHLIRCLAVTQDYMTTDDVWETLGDAQSTHERRALGAVMQQAARNGWIKPTDRTRPSARPACHARPVRVWQSLIRPGVA